MDAQGHPEPTDPHGPPPAERPDRPDAQADASTNAPTGARPQPGDHAGAWQDPAPQQNPSQQDLPQQDTTRVDRPASTPGPDRPTAAFPAGSTAAGSGEHAGAAGHAPGAGWEWAPPQQPAAEWSRPATQPFAGGQFAADPYGMASPYSPYGAPAGAPTSRSGRRWRMGVAGLLVGAVVGGGVGAGVATLAAPSQASSSGTPAQSVVIKDPKNATTATAAAAKAAPSVVTIYVTNNQSAGSGSGVVLDSAGYVLTNNHVVTLEGSGIGQVQVRTANGKLYNASVVGTDPSSDLAVVKLDGASGMTPATFANSDKVQVGDVAVAIGAPLGLSNTVTDGIVSAVGRAVETGSTANDSTVIDAIQTDAAINPGNSGGALVNAAGQVIGINSAIATVASGGIGGQSGQSGNIGVGFAIPSNTAKRIAEQIIKTGKASHALLGVTARTATESSNPEIGIGAQLVSVEPGSAASNAGLQPGDVVTALGSRPISSSVDLTAAVRSTAPGSTVTLTIQRNGTQKTVRVTLGETTTS